MSNLSAKYTEDENAAPFNALVLHNRHRAILELEFTQAGEANTDPLEVTYGRDTYTIKRHVNNGKIDYGKYDFMGRLQKPILITLDKKATRGNPFGYGGRRRRRTRRVQYRERLDRR